MILNMIYTFDSLHTISMSVCGIYCITCTVNGKKYVGSSKNVQSRMRMHKYNAEHDNTKLPLLYGEMCLYGLEFFIIEILEQCPEKAMLEREDYWIKVLHTNTEGYNIRQKADLRGKKRGEVSFLIQLEKYNLFGYIMHKMPRHICGIYCITSLDTGKQYVGRSTDLKTRLRLHRYDSLKHPEFSPELYADMRIYSIERFKVELLEECSVDNLAARERHWLNALCTEHNGYNYDRRDFRHTDETKQRFSWLRKGRVFSDEHRRKLSQAGMGRKYSEESIKALQRGGRKQSRLSEQDVKDIKKLMQQRVSPSEIMSTYNIGRGTYYDIKYGRSWRDVEADE
jgi:group I intron endonuclease